MCNRRENEPWYSYAFRMVCEKPGGALTASGWVVACVFCWIAYTFYQDNKAASERQTAAYLENSQLMAEVRSELRSTREALNELKAWHKEEFKKQTNL